MFEIVLRVNKRLVGHVDVTNVGTSSSDEFGPTELRPYRVVSWVRDAVTDRAVAKDFGAWFPRVADPGTFALAVLAEIDLRTENETRKTFVVEDTP